jgi:hypothetical protein
MPPYFNRWLGFIHARTRCDYAGMDGNFLGFIWINPLSIPQKEGR